MDKKIQIGLGILSAIPLPLASVMVIAFINTVPIETTVPTIDQYVQFLTSTSPLLLFGWNLISILTIVLSILYNFHALRNRTISLTSKVMWAISLWVFSFFAIPLYWLIHVLQLKTPETV